MKIAFCRFMSRSLLMLIVLSFIRAFFYTGCIEETLSQPENGAPVGEKTLEELEKEKEKEMLRKEEEQRSADEKKREERRIRENALKNGGGVWKDHKGFAWVNPYEKNIWNYNIAIAKEAALMGFREIQFDYVRFPENATRVDREAFYPGSNDMLKEDAIKEFLFYAREQLQEYMLHSTGFTMDHDDYREWIEGWAGMLSSYEIAEKTQTGEKLIFYPNVVVSAAEEKVITAAPFEVFKENHVWRVSLDRLIDNSVMR